MSAPLWYTANVSLDGYIEDAEGSFDFTRPSDEVHAFINELERPVGTYLYGRRLYETMRYWEDGRGPDGSAVRSEFADIWRAASKVVFSTSLEAVTTAQTELVRHFDPEEVRARKQAADRPLTVGGAGLAVAAFAAGLVDECHMFVRPITVGGGKPAMPAGQRVELDLIAERRFTDGVVFLHYRVRS